ncbi:peptidase inhibitor family I36 protein [Streptomyces luteolus]|uniref:Peptidase inhibitor family I36 protein n=1 Tax=Streptomyces luteolus TaxID=3043615 RepID=A0ABT6T485_9ACTN|nr:peptidase inhibitor family I36 protein [Streptomyces sp. B-S-A12]MDI3422672.1 peptidase inhibitor family I36 protein [Streptomyces sp. B-S-A12]
MTRNKRLAGALFLLGVLTLTGFTAHAANGDTTDTSTGDPAGAKRVQAAEPYKVIVGSGDRSDCPDGYLCLWTRPDYKDLGVAIYGSERNWEFNMPQQMRDIIIGNHDSVYNNGYGEATTSKDAVRLFRGNYYSDGWLTLCRLDGIRNLAGGRTDTEPGRGFTDAFHSNEWFDPKYC